MLNSNDDIKVYKSVCSPCHSNCGVLVHVKDGRVLKIEGDPEHPENEGAMCVRGLSFTQLLYHPDRITHPMKRIGEKGEGKWQRISWDEALDTITSKITQAREEQGPESIAFSFCDGDRGNRVPGTALLSALGSPMNCGTDAHYCYRPQGVACMVTFGRGNFFTGHAGFDFADTKCSLIWGANLFESQMSKGKDIIKGLKKGAKLIVVDPRFTNLAAKADIWLQVRPAADGALALGMLNYIIEQGLYDKEFVDKYCYGFQQLKERARDYPLDKVAKITWVNEEDIRRAATLYATTKPATLALYMGVSMTTNAMQTMRAIHSLIALTGNVDVKGGNLLFDRSRLPVASAALEPRITLPKEEMEKAPGVKDKPMFFGKDALIFSHSHPPAFFDMLHSGEPYKIKFLLSVSDPVMGLQDTRKISDALKNMDFFVDVDFFMTPTANLADIVLPAATYLERDKVWAAFYHNFFCVAGKAIEPVEECRDEVDIFIELAERLNLEIPIPMKSVAQLNDFMLEPTGMTFDDLRGKGVVHVPFEYRKHEKPGYQFPTETGKIELFSKYFEKYGYDPLPYFEEPPQSPYSTPDLHKDYPFILISGSRTNCYYHGLGRQIPWLRELVPEPTIEIHPSTAEELGIKEGDWVWIEGSQNKGRVRQKAEITQGIHPKVVHARSHWWFPEREEDPERGYMESNINVIMSTDEPYDPISGSTVVRGCLCRIYKAE
ncbi:molybdopterin-dependent oxidoreductase [Thermodesulfobacteriota bacterium]